MAQFSTACNKMAREYSRRKNPEAQSRYAAEYVQVTKEIMGMDTRNLPEFQKERLSLIQNYFLLEEAKYALREGRTADARKIYETMETGMEGQKNLGYRINAFKEVKIALLIQEGRLEEAEQTARENVQLALKYRGEKYKDYLSQLEILAHVLELKKWGEGVMRHIRNYTDPFAEGLPLREELDQEDNGSYGRFFIGKARVVVLLHMDDAPLFKAKLLQKVLHHQVIGMGVDAQMAVLG